ncbi:MAG: glycosyltransferase family 39 protein [Chloroflexi bacterium]|nr:glycosyltransferase family 39 protein [Chloroflexota bacterium]
MNGKSTTKKQRNRLRLILLAYAALGIAYMLATPPLESSDEYKHYPVVQYIQTQRKLPILDPDDPGLWLQEGAQPPLYYLLMATLTSWIDTGDLPIVHHKNPHAFVGNPDQIKNKNLIIHDPAQERFPGQGSVLAVYVIRLASIGLGLGTVWLIYQLGSLLFLPPIDLLAVALTAFNPMFLFVNAAVNNDSLANLLGHWGLYLLVKLWRDTPDPRAEWRRYAGLGLVLGLGILTKLSLGGLLGLTGLALAWLAWRRGQWRLLFIGGVITLAAALTVSGWMFVRNWQVYGDLTGLNAFIAVQGTREVPLDWAGWVDEFGTFYRSYWGLFGGVNVAAPDAFYGGANLLALVGVVGLTRWLRQKWGMLPPGLWLLPAWGGVLLALLIRWNVISPAFQGRLIFPALGALNLLWAAGLLAWVKPDWRSRLAAGLAGALLLAATALPWTTIRPAYAYPEPLTAVPPPSQFGPITFEAGQDRLQLVGIDMDARQSVKPGGKPVKVVLYWRAETPVEKDYLSAVHLLGREFESVGAINRYPAWGMIPTSHWQPGQIWQDEYHVRVKEPAIAPAQLRVSVSLYDSEAEKTLPATWPDGAAINPLLVGEPARLTSPARQLPRSYVLNAPFADGVTLVGYLWNNAPESESLTAVPGNALPITLYWRSEGTPMQDYTVFVHLLNANGEWVAGADAPPVNNFYPTSMWQERDWIDDLHTLALPVDLPPGDYVIRIGLYDPVTGARLAQLDGGDAVDLSLKIED